MEITEASRNLLIKIVTIANDSTTLNTDTAPAIAADFQTSNSGAITAAPVTTPNAFVRNNAMILPVMSCAFFILCHLF